jgi:ethanolamine utilization protein EutP (predicted NTPase)
MTATISRSKSYYHTIMTMTATIGRHKSYYHTIMTMIATIGIEVNLKSYNHDHDRLAVMVTIV